MNSKIITISIDEETLELFDKIAEKEYSDRSKLVRKWITDYYKKHKTE